MKFYRETSHSFTHVVERVFHPTNEVSHPLVEQHCHRDDQPNVVDWPVGRCTIENFSFWPEITDRTRNARSKSSNCLIKKGSNQSTERSKDPRDWMQLIFRSLINNRSSRRLIPWTSLFLSRNWRVHLSKYTFHPRSTLSSQEKANTLLRMLAFVYLNFCRGTSRESCLDPCLIFLSRFLQRLKFLVELRADHRLFHLAFTENNLSVQRLPTTFETLYRWFVFGIIFLR